MSDAPISSTGQAPQVRHDIFIHFPIATQSCRWGRDASFKDYFGSLRETKKVETATIINQQGAIWDEAQLFDDGQHGDSSAGDSYYGVILPPVILEDAFQFSYQVMNANFPDTLVFPEDQMITSIGPLVSEGYRIISQGSNRLQLELELRNQGFQATATEVRAELISRDSSVIQIINNNESFGDIPAGGTAMNSNAYIIDTIENPGILSFAVRISMGGYPYWLHKGLIVGIEPVPKQLPKEFALYQNYPNPFNPHKAHQLMDPTPGPQVLLA